MASDWPPPTRYRGRLNAFARIAEDPEKPPQHFHACPECYEYEFCTEDCTLEPDLERDNGYPCGSHLHCSTCQPREPVKVPPPPIPVEQLSLGF